MRVATIIVAVALAGLAGCGDDDGDAPSGAQGGPLAAQDPPRETGRAAQAGDALTLRQAVGQHFVFAYDGRRPPAALRRRIERGEAAGVILFARNVGSATALRSTMRSLQAIRRPEGLDAPLLVMVDQEGGPVRRIPGAPERAAASVRTSAQARADGRAAARNLRSAGVNVDLAPVADVPRPGSALEREKRTYSRPASNVGRLASGFARGLEQGGVRSTAKHYPGFGAAGTNTDFSAQRITSDVETLRSVDEVPFRTMIGAGVDLVMLSTAVYPALDARPAALSRPWVTDQLRGRLAFDGVTITDDLQTPAVKGFGGPRELAVRAVRAGVDLPLFAQGYTQGAQGAEGVLAAAQRGDIPRAELDAGAARVLALRARVGRRVR